MTHSFSLIERKLLLRLGGWAAILAALLVPMSIYVFIQYPPPYDESAVKWFELFNDNIAIGLISTDILLLLTWLLLIPVYFAIALTVGKKPLLVVSGVILFIIALVSFIGSNPSVEMLSLSDRYQAANSVEKDHLISAGEAVMARFDGTSFHISYVLGQLAGILVGVAMLSSGAFKRLTAWLLIVGNLVGYALYIPTVGLVLSAFSGMILWVWFILIAKDLFRLARTNSEVFV